MSRSATANEWVTLFLRSSSARNRSSSAVRITGLTDSGSTGMIPPLGLATSTSMPASRNP